MTLNSNHRGAHLTLVAAITALTVALVLLVAPGHAEPAGASAMSTPTSSARALALRSAMDKLWEDHITWTRMVIVDFAAGLPDLQTAEARLLRNQVDIGNAIKPYYGDAAGNQLTALLREHILGAARVLAALKAGDQPALQAALAAWYANAHDIAVFLNSANPKNWPLAEMDQMMRDHLDATTREAVARHQGNWNADVAAYDAVHVQALAMADMLSNGIMAQFPSRFRP